MTPVNLLMSDRKITKMSFYFHACRFAGRLLFLLLPSYEGAQNVRSKIDNAILPQSERMTTLHCRLPRARWGRRRGRSASNRAMKSAFWIALMALTERRLILLPSLAITIFCSSGNNCFPRCGGSVTVARTRTAVV